jgi:glycosyltransferase involved in cell wall biosynthesis
LQGEAFVHYVRRGAVRGISPHPFFDAKQYLSDHPNSETHPGGPLGHYLHRGWLDDALPSSRFDPSAYRRAVGDISGPPLADFARWVGTLLRATRGHEHLPRTSANFDYKASATFVRDVLQRYRALAEAAPKVSIVLPTKDRAAGVVDAIRSVMQQTYLHWELIVVDDGSTDSTSEAVRPLLADSRIRMIRREHPCGVAAARNAGLAQASGDYVAYLDSDNTWTSDFLQVMVAFVRTEGLRFAYAVSELVEDKPNGRHCYRALAFDRQALLEKNYIDCIVVLHERSLLDEVGVFDDQLRRNVDWDLFIRMAKVTDFGHAPFIATRYDAWEQRSDRITVNEPFGYRYVILAKHGVGWELGEAGLGGRAPGSVSIVIHVAGPSPYLTTTLERLLDLHGDEVEVLVVDAKLPDIEAMELQLLALTHPKLRVVRESKTLSAEVGRNLGACQATGELIVFLTADTFVEPGWLDSLLRPLRDGSAAATQPLILSPDGTVWSAGIAFARGTLAHNVYRGLPGDAPEVVRASSRQALSARVLAVRANEFISVRGFEALFVNDLDNGDLSLRLGVATDQALAYVPASLVSLLQSPTRPQGFAAAVATHNVEKFVDRWRDRFRVDAEEVWSRGGYAIIGYQRNAETHLGFDPIIVHDRPQRPLRWSIKIGAPTAARRSNWGDWHFGVGLKHALERLGHEAVVDCRGAWDRSTSRLDDVALVLRGVSPHVLNPQQINVLWVISHPEHVTMREAVGYDAVFAASDELAQRFAGALGRPVEPLLQCTDQHRFRSVAPDLTRRHEVLFVGNARGVRHSVASALEVGIVPTVYGLRWAGLLPDGAWAGKYLPNEDLPATYRAAGVVLNDHWSDMRSQGLLSNRLFDLAACGARVVSDEVPGMRDVFGDAVLTFQTPAELGAAVATHLSESPERRELREELSNRVRRAHSFDARARRLVEVVRRLQANGLDERVKYEA